MLILVSVLEIVSVKHLTCKEPGAHFTYKKQKPAPLDTSSPNTWVSESDTAGEIPAAANVLHHFAILAWSQDGAQRTEPGGRSESRLLQPCTE